MEQENNHHEIIKSFSEKEIDVMTALYAKSNAEWKLFSRESFSALAYVALHPWRIPRLRMLETTQATSLRSKKIHDAFLAKNTVLEAANQPRSKRMDIKMKYTQVHQVQKDKDAKRAGIGFVATMAFTAAFAVVDLYLLDKTPPLPTYQTILALLGTVGPSIMATPFWLSEFFQRSEYHIPDVEKAEDTHPVQVEDAQPAVTNEPFRGDPLAVRAKADAEFTKRAEFVEMEKKLQKEIDDRNGVFILVDTQNPNQRFSFTSADGTRFTLDSTGKPQAVHFENIMSMKADQLINHVKRISKAQVSILTHARLYKQYDTSPDQQTVALAKADLADIFNSMLLSVNEPNSLIWVAFDLETKDVDIEGKPVNVRAIYGLQGQVANELVQFVKEKGNEDEIYAVIRLFFGDYDYTYDFANGDDKLRKRRFVSVPKSINIISQV